MKQKVTISKNSTWVEGNIKMDLSFGRSEYYHLTWRKCHHLFQRNRVVGDTFLASSKVEEMPLPNSRRT